MVVCFVVGWMALRVCDREIQVSGLSIIIPSRSIDNLHPCVAAVRKHEPDVRIIVVDDGLPDRSEVDAITIDGRKPFNFAANCNIGIRAAGEDDVILLNDDALLESPDGLSLLQCAAQENPEYGIIGAVTNLTGQHLQHRDVREAADWARTRAAKQRVGDVWSWPPEKYSLLPSDGLREASHIAFVCVLIPRRTIETVGLLDERYCLDWGCEDADYCEQVTRAGLRIAVHDGCYVDHGSLRSTKRGEPRAPSEFRQNYKLLVEKWGGHLITQPILFHLLRGVD